jgi:translation elongation factor EF-1beta
LPEAIVLVNTDIGSEEEVLNKISSIEGVTEVYVAFLEREK